MTCLKPLRMLLMASLFLAIVPARAVSADREDQTLRALVPKIVSAWGTLDISKVDPYYATDADFAYFDINPMKYDNWKDYRQGVQKALFEPNRTLVTTAWFWKP